MGIPRVGSLMIIIAVLQATAAFAPGDLCYGIDLSSPAHSLLRGKHLRVHETPWYPFAIKDATAPHGWRGLDIDLLDGVSEILGFTYEILEAVRLPHEPRWTDTLLRTVEDVDMWASWWMRDEERMNHTIMLAGHIDVSPTLIRPPLDIEAAGSLVDSLYTFYQPFSPQLWACLVAMVLLGGSVDYFVERGNGGTLFSSLYEYSAGVLWGGFQDPHTRMSALYQVANAFIILVAVSVYTANLASLLIVNRRPKAGFESLEDLMASHTTVCTVGSYPSQITYEASYPSLAFSSFDQHSLIADALNGRGQSSCAAALGPRIDFNTWLTNGSNCELATVGPSLFLASAGWVSNSRSEPCLQRAIEFAMHSMQARGITDALLKQWMPIVGCEDAIENGDGRRRLENGDGRRRLKGGAKGGGDAGGESVSDMQFDVADFFGLFSLWATITLLVVVAKLVDMLLAHRKRIRESAHALRAEDGSSVDGETVLRGGAAPAGANETAIALDLGPKRTPRAADRRAPSLLPWGFLTSPNPSEYPQDLDINNTSAMLRYLVMQDQEHKAALAKLGEALTRSDGRDAGRATKKHAGRGMIRGMTSKIRHSRAHAAEGGDGSRGSRPVHPGPSLAPGDGGGAYGGNGHGSEYKA